MRGDHPAQSAATAWQKGLSPLQQHHRLGGDTFAPPDGPHPLVGGRLDIYLLLIQLQVSSNIGAHLWYVWRHLGGLGMNGGIDIHQLPVLCLHPLISLAQQKAAISPLVLRNGIWKEPADIPQCCCPQQSVSQSVQQNICIRMAHQTPLMGYGHPADNQW